MDRRNCSRNCEQRAGKKKENESCSIKSFQLTGNVYFLICFDVVCVVFK